MRIITISREFGSGGRELGKRMADILGFDYYDSEIISAVAENSGFDEHYVETTLDNHGWQSFPITFQSTLASSAYIHSNKLELLLEQKKVIEQIAEIGKDCIIVGRNADVLLKKHNPFNIFVCASKEAKIKRCMSRANADEKVSESAMSRKIKRIDRARAHTRAILSNSVWGDRSQYHITVNTTDWDIKNMANHISNLALSWFGEDNENM